MKIVSKEAAIGICVLRLLLQYTVELCELVVLEENSRYRECHHCNKHTVVSAQMNCSFFI